MSGSRFPNGITAPNLGGGGIVMQNYTLNATQGATQFAHGITDFSNTTDTMLVFKNGMLLYETQHYTVSGLLIIMANNFVLDENDELLCVAFIDSKS